MIVDLFQKTRASSRRIKNPKESAHAPVTVTCKTCGREWSAQQYGKNGYVCPECGTHGRIRCRERIRLTVDKDSFSELFGELATGDPLGFPGYAEKISKLRARSGLEDAVLTGNRMAYFMKLIGWTMAGNLKYFDQLACVIALTLGKAMGSAGRAISWAGMLTGPICGKGYIEHCGFKPNLKKHPVLGRLPMLKDLCAMDEAFAAVDDHPEGYVIGMNEPETQLKKHIRHKDGKFHTWCSEIDDYIKRITPEAEEKDLVLKDGCNMILSAGRHSEEGHNATMRNPATFKYRQPYTLAMNPEDGKEMGIADGQMVRVSTNTGSLEIPVEYTWQTARGYVLIPHHFGYKFEGKTYGVYVNLLTSHKDLDELTGNPIWRYTPCRVEAI